jgi:hypothetical protein
MGRKMIDLMNRVGIEPCCAGQDLLQGRGLFQNDKLVVDQLIHSCGRR